MSKKMLKRSLALGALMAFVITGSAMAAEITTQAEAYIVNGQDDVNLEGRIYANQCNINIEDIDTLTITSGDNTAIYARSVDEDTEAKISVKVNYLNVYADGTYGIRAASLNDGGKTFSQNSFISLGEENNPISKIFIETPNGYGLYSGGRQDISRIDVFAKELYIESGSGAIKTYRSGEGIFLGSELKPIEKISLLNNNSGNYTVTSFAGPISIFGDEVLIENKAGGTAIHLTNDDINIKSKNLTINGDITTYEYQIGTEEKLYTVNINKDFEDGLVRINGNINTTSTNNKPMTGVNITLGKEGSFLKGAVTDNNGKATLNMNPGTIWEVTGESNINKVAGNQGILKVDETGNVLVEVTNGQDAKNFTLMGSKEASASLNGDDLAGELDNLAKTVSGINFASYEFEEGAALGAIEAYQENGVWKITERTNVTNSNISDVAALGLMAWRAENNDMNKRLGELRNSNGEHGVWVRMVRGESEYNSVKNQYNTYQLGYDEKLSVDKSWTVGMALTYTDGESSFNGGNGENKHKGLAIYGSKLNDDGSFIDLIAKYARLDHDVEVGTEKGDYEANGYSVSAEYGKRFQQGNGLWVEPQVELTYGKVGSADYMIGKNRAVTHEGMESLVGRVGFSLGKDIKQGNVYARASYLYDFEGETEASYTDAIGNVRNINDDLGGGWWEVGVGANINLSKATYIYADVEKTFGGEVDTNWQWNLGVRYSF
ncbi:MAG: autotransporter outer membrane beta-barrel domain-containing protein [Phascolarctobacterium sp.]|nr:autotransporter outer membrane beta-barrel domain-containing protein [Phascolarctobacterium sp.]